MEGHFTQNLGWFQKPLWRCSQNPLILQCRNGGFCAFQKDLFLEDLSAQSIANSVEGISFFRANTLGAESNRKD
jgi:hypothetical protein